MVQEVNNLRANIIRTNCFGGGNYTPLSETIELFDPSGLPYEPVGDRIGTENDPYVLPDEVTVEALAPEKKPLLGATAVPEPREIKLRPPMPRAASDLIAQFGGKMQKREVNGEKQQIAIIKNGKQEVKFLVNEDGTLGEQLVTLSTRGKNKYITQSEHNRNIERFFPNGLPNGVEVEYAHNGNQYYPVFKQDGKAMSTMALNNLIAQQSSQKPDDQT